MSRYSKAKLYAKKQRMKHDAILATINAPTAYQASQDGSIYLDKATGRYVKASTDSAYKVYAGRLDAMPDRKLTFEYKSNPLHKERNKTYNSFSEK